MNVTHSTILLREREHDSTNVVPSQNRLRSGGISGFVAAAEDGKGRAVVGLDVLEWVYVAHGKSPCHSHNWSQLPSWW